MTMQPHPALTIFLFLTHVEGYAESRQFGMLGTPRVNVLLLNVALDGIR